jgi:hypothetical protein
MWKLQNCKKIKTLLCSTVGTLHHEHGLEECIEWKIWQCKFVGSTEHSWSINNILSFCFLVSITNLSKSSALGSYNIVMHEYLSSRSTNTAWSLKIGCIMLQMSFNQARPTFPYSEDRASWYILIIKPTTCTNFSNLFLEYNSCVFRTGFLSIIRSLALYTQ